MPTAASLSLFAKTNPLRVCIPPFFVTDVSNFVVVEELEDEVSVTTWTA